MIATPIDYDSKQIARIIGEVRLQLPPVFRDKICTAVDEGLQIHSHRVSSEVKDIIIAQIALGLRAAGMEEILKTEAERHQRTIEAKKYTFDHDRLEFLKRQQSKTVDPFFEIITSKPRPSFHQVESKFDEISYVCDFLADEDAKILRTWAVTIFNKFKLVAGVRS